MERGPVSKAVSSVCAFLVRTPVRAASNMVEVFVDGNPIAVEPGTTVLQVRDVAELTLTHQLPVAASCAFPSSVVYLLNRCLSTVDDQGAKENNKTRTNSMRLFQ